MDPLELANALDELLDAASDCARGGDVDDLVRLTRDVPLIEQILNVELGEYRTDEAELLVHTADGPTFVVTITQK